MSFRPEDASAYQPAADPPRRMGPRAQAIENCDEIVPVTEVLREIGAKVPESISYGWKILCPWSDEHSDPLDPAMRIYPETHVFCFDGHGQLRPSQLAARSWNTTRGRAAERLLEARGLLRGRDYRERWAELAAERNTTTQASQDTAEITQAVQTVLAGDPAYAAAEFSEVVRLEWAATLAELKDLPRRVEELSAWGTQAVARIRGAALTVVNADGTIRS